MKVSLALAPAGSVEVVATPSAPSPATMQQK
jgi:hypothetical protein